MKLFTKNPQVESFHPLADGLQPGSGLGPLGQGLQQSSARNSSATAAVSSPKDSVVSTPRTFVTTASEASHPVSAQALTRALSAPATTSLVRRVLRGQATRAQALEQLAARAEAAPSQSIDN